MRYLDAEMTLVRLVLTGHHLAADADDGHGHCAGETTGWWPASAGAVGCCGDRVRGHAGLHVAAVAQRRALTRRRGCVSQLYDLAGITAAEVVARLAGLERNSASLWGVEEGQAEGGEAVKHGVSMAEGAD